MNNIPASGTMNFQGISEHLNSSISSLIDSSQQLQGAVIARDVDAVWRILAEQQEQMQEFDKYNYLWKQVVVDSGIDSPQIREIKSEIQHKLQQLRHSGDSNASLVRSFLAALGKAFKRASGNVGAKSKVYGKKGKMAYKQSSLLVNRLG